MKKIFMALIFAALVLGLSSVALATVLTFDDLPHILFTPAPIPGEPIAPVPDGYGGFNWGSLPNQMYYFDWTEYQKYVDDPAIYGPGVVTQSGYKNGTVSTPNVAFNVGGNDVSITDGVFTFNGAYITAAWNNGLNIDIKGYNSGTELFSRTIVVDTLSPTWFNFNWSGIDKIFFHAYGGTDAGYWPEWGGPWFAMDNFTYNESTAVPEPGTLILLGISTMSLVGLKRWWKC